MKGYDYSQSGAYFVTICTRDRECLFGRIDNGEMLLNEYGEIIEECLMDLPEHYGNMELDCHIVMPNHFHGIIIINDISHTVPVGAGFTVPVGAGLKPAPTGTSYIIKCHGLPEMVRALKTFSARRINEKRLTRGVPVWQRNYYERIIRDKDEFHRIRKYIINNPKNWVSDENNIK